VEDCHETRAQENLGDGPTYTIAPKNEILAISPPESARGWRDSSLRGRKVVFWDGLVGGEWGGGGGGFFLKSAENERF